MRRKNFEEFKVAVVEGIREWLPEAFQTADISLHVVTKNNDLKLTGLTIQSVGNNVAPVIYLESFYKRYEEGTEMETILRKIAEIRVEHEMNEGFDMSTVMDFYKCQDKIFPRLIGAMWNQDMLEDRPHVIIEDLAVVFQVELGVWEGNGMSMPVQNKLLHTWGITVEELYEKAVDNLTDSREGKFVSMNEMMASIILPDLLEEYDGDRYAAEQMLQILLPEELKMYVLTRKDQMYGASILLDKKMMEKVIEKVGSDFYILPSSIHECLIVPADEELTPERLEDMVREINHTEVSVEERLSNNVYRYTLTGGLKLA